MDYGINRMSTKIQIYTEVNWITFISKYSYFCVQRETEFSSFDIYYE